MKSKHPLPGRLLLLSALVLAAILFAGFHTPVGEDAWGFFGHRRINRLAVFTLPPDLIVFYKKHIEYVTEHAVDPDKRRYATKHEAVRHYMDLDHWGAYPFPDVPRNWVAALEKYTALQVNTSDGKVLVLRPDLQSELSKEGYLAIRDSLSNKQWVVGQREYRNFFLRNVLPLYYEDAWSLSCDTLTALFGDIGCTSALAREHFTAYGIVPYHLAEMQRRLTAAFRAGDMSRILRTSAEMGHYIGDAHVPLHTTSNYNGQLTDQLGIHAFWESRIPELFADKTYDFFVGKATYIADPQEYYWEVVLTSHLLVDSVLSIEKDLSRIFPPDQQYCFEERLNATIKTQCRDYAQAYSDRMRGMVEERMRASIQTIGSSWYTAWVDAGQPDMRKLGSLQLSPEEAEEIARLEKSFQQGEGKGRAHE